MSRTWLLVLVAAGVAQAACAYSLRARQDALILRGLPDVNQGHSPQVCVTGSHESLYLLSWDFSDYVGFVAEGDGVFTLRGTWTQGDDVLAGLYELIGGPFDEDVVTYGSYVGASSPSSVLEALCDTSNEEGWSVQFTVPRQTINRLLDGRIDGLAIGSAPGAVANCCYATLDSHPTQPKPTLTFDARLGEPDRLPGDANGDGAVTDADYTLWADNYGRSDADWAHGDFNGDSRVTDADYTLWADHYGQSASVVPEPATLVSLLGGLVAVRRCRRSRPTARKAGGRGGFADRCISPLIDP